MKVIRRYRDDGHEVKTVSLSLAVTVFVTMLSGIMFLGGARWSEQSIASRLTVLERNQEATAQSLSELVRRQSDHEVLGAARGGRLGELETELKLLKQREDFYHGQRR